MLMKTALDLIYQELRKLNIKISEPLDPSQPQPVPSPPFVMNTTFPSSHQQQDQPLQQPLELQPAPQLQSEAPQVSYAIPPPGVFSFASPPMPERLTPPSSMAVDTDSPPLVVPNDLNSEDVMAGLEITPELFEAFSYVDQLPSSNAAMFDTTWPETVVNSDKL
ncbi:hypothetical protein KEM55_007207 [Ascosphaera atra]|nr:hypothetical protein KEM55_007207 [Ascosphaera atra]